MLLEDFKVDRALSAEEQVKGHREEGIRAHSILRADEQDGER